MTRAQKLEEAEAKLEGLFVCTLCSEHKSTVESFMCADCIRQDLRRDGTDVHSVEVTSVGPGRVAVTAHVINPTPIEYITLQIAKKSDE